MRNIIITGASSGIGKELVYELSKDTDNHIIIISRNANKINSIAGSCNIARSSTAVFPIEFDLTNFDYNKLVTKINAIFSGIDILINNAGLLYNKPFLKMSLSDFDDIMATNIKSPYFLIQSLLPHFNSNSHIVNLSSMGGVQGSLKFKGLSAYSISKGGLITLTECLAEELKEKKININSIALGSVQTEMFEKAFPNANASAVSPDIAKWIANFALNSGMLVNGKTIQLSNTTP